MWGNIVTEVALQSNFNIGFNNNKSDVLIHLTQWQYWWWFWFWFLWAFYYLVILRIVRFRSLKFRPRIVTSLRPHGKWGDLIICLIPISWCANILTNSTLILKMIEWQSETGLLTVRIRGKQWYWIYKFELKTFTDIITIPKNIGRNKWQIITPGDSQISDDFLQILKLRSQNKWVKNYWNDLSTKFSKKKDLSLVSPVDQLKYDFFYQYELNKTLYSYKESSLNLNFFGSSILENEDEKINLSLYNDKIIFNKKNNFFVRLFNKKIYWTDFNIDKDLFNLKKIQSNLYFDLNYSDRIKNFGYKLNMFNFFLENDFVKKSLNKLELNKNQFYNYNDFFESNRWFKKSQGNTSLRFIKYPVSNKFFFESNKLIELFKFRFNEHESAIKHKPVSDSVFLTIKQKRYKRRKNIPNRVKFEKLSDGSNSKKIRLSNLPFLINNEHVINNILDSSKEYNLFKKNKTRYENTSVVLSKRLLRTRRTLVLPAHVNITAVTNSYDVVHSWFIPGLGLKMDCIPGRATHHNFYIDNVGFYYGQCAEICGRYHHHMPIRICALPFEHFLLWWHTFGLSKMLFTKNSKRFSYHYGSRKYKW